MLGKLMRNEVRETYKMALTMLALIVAVTILGIVCATVSINAEYLGKSQSELAAFLGSMSMFGTILLYVISLMVAFYGMTIYLGYHFYQTMFTERGYLTHTLPVKQGQLLFSKTLIGSIWVFFITLGIAISYFSVAWVVVQRTALMAGNPITLSDVTHLFGEVWQVLLENMHGGFLVRMIVTVVLILLLSPFSTISTIFASLSIGQLAKRHKLFMGILTYFGIGVVHWIINMLMSAARNVVVARSFFDSDEMARYMLGTYEGSMLLMLILGLGLYFVSLYLIGKKLNLE